MPAKRPAAKTPALKKPTSRKKPTVPAAVETSAIEPKATKVTAARSNGTNGKNGATATETKAVELPHDEVRRRAYAYWMAGNPDPVANWFQAENDLRAETRAQ